jgi:hypothetical protein
MQLLIMFEILVDGYRTTASGSCFRLIFSVYEYSLAEACVVFLEDWATCFNHPDFQHDALFVMSWYDARHDTQLRYIGFF